VYSWRVKETERMVAIVTECRKLGATVEEFRDYCVITPPKKVRDNTCVSVVQYILGWCSTVQYTIMQYST
jgi:5-enolpyruvylshikimate-3-phosphate synthase